MLTLVVLVLSWFGFWFGLGSGFRPRFSVCSFWFTAFGFRLQFLVRVLICDSGL